MTRLGYERFAVHGTDVGAGVAGLLPMVARGRVIGTHVTVSTAAMPFGPPLDPEGLDDADRARAERFNEYRETGSGYLHMQATRPGTLGYLLSDSPVGQLAWIAEEFHEWTDPAAERPEDAGPPRGVAVFAADTTIRRLLDPAGAIEHWTEDDRSGHFPAMEVPDLVTGDLRAFFGARRPAQASAEG